MNTGIPRRRGAAKAFHFSTCPRSTSTGTIPCKRKRLSRELEGLAPWSGWKRASIPSRSRGATPRRGESAEPEKEGEEETTGSSSSAEGAGLWVETIRASPAHVNRAQRHLKVRSERGYGELRRNTVEWTRTIEVIHLDDDSDEGDTITVVASNVEPKGTRQLKESTDHPAPTPPPDTPKSPVRTGRAHTPPSIDTQSEDLIALAGPRCPLCICPINSVNFPVISCSDCNRTYHKSCICYGQCPQYHPFRSSSIPAAERCSRCGCPEGDDLAVHCGHPGILFRRRDQDAEFREYFRKGRMEAAKYEDLL